MGPRQGQGQRSREFPLQVVKEGVSFSMARNAEFEKAVDNPTPITRQMIRTGVQNAKKENHG